MGDVGLVLSGGLVGATLGAIAMFVDQQRRRRRARAAVEKAWLEFLEHRDDPLEGAQLVLEVARRIANIEYL